MTVLRLAAVLLILVMLSTSMVCGRYARYVTTTTFRDGAHVAAYVFHVQENGEEKFVDLSTIRKPGDNVTCTLIVSNERNRRISDVPEDFTVSLKISGNMPLVCSVNGEKVADLSQMQADAPSTSWQTSGRFDASDGLDNTKTFTIFVDWPRDYNQAIFANGACVAEMELIVTSVQGD